MQALIRWCRAGLLLGALAQLRAGVLVGLTVASQRRLELRQQLPDRRRALAQSRQRVVDLRDQRLVTGRRRGLLTKATLAVRALASDAIEHRALRRQLCGQLRAPVGAGALVGRGPPALDLGRHAPALFDRLVVRPDRGAVGADEPLALGVGGRGRGGGAVDGAAGVELGLGGAL